MTDKYQAETYVGEAFDTAMMLARLDYPESQIAGSISRIFPLVEQPEQLARDALTAVQAERAEES